MGVRANSHLPLKKRIKYFFQRAIRGYDDECIYSIDYEFCDRYIKILSHYKDINKPHPYSITHEEWNNVIAEMINDLVYIKDNMFKVSSKEEQEKLTEVKNNFMLLWSNWFFDLWM